MIKTVPFSERDGIILKEKKKKTWSLLHALGMGCRRTGSLSRAAL